MPIAIFPEGTITNGAQMVTFNKGPFVPLVPVTPVCLSISTFTNRYSVCASGDNTSYLSLFRLMFGFGTRVRVTVLEPELPPSTEEGANAILAFAERVKGKIVAEMGVASTEHNYKDVKLNYATGRLRISADFFVDEAEELFGIGEFVPSVTNLFRFCWFIYIFYI